MEAFLHHTRDFWLWLDGVECTPGGRKLLPSMEVSLGCSLSSGTSPGWRVLPCRRRGAEGLLFPEGMGPCVAHGKLGSLMT